VAISAGLTAATLRIVSYSVQKRVRESLHEELRDSVATYVSFEKQRDDSFTKSVELIANLPNNRAVMTTEDPDPSRTPRLTVQTMSNSLRHRNRESVFPVHRSDRSLFQFVAYTEFSSP